MLLQPFENNHIDTKIHSNFIGTTATFLLPPFHFPIYFHFLLHFSLSRFIRDNLLTMATLCGAIAGVALGLSLKSMGDGIYTPRQARYIMIDGEGGQLN